MLHQNAAAVDLGTNSFRLLIAEMSDFGFRTLAKELRTVRLGQHLNATGVLSNEAQNRALDALAFFADRIKTFPSLPIKACGTAALRQAANSAAFITKAAAILETDIHILSEEEEARLAVRGALSALQINSAPFCFVDIGGGSTEIVLVRPASHAESKTVFPGTSLVAGEILSIPVGAVNLTEQFFCRCPPSTEEVERIALHLEATLTPRLTNIRAYSDRGQPLMVVGSGGTATALAAVALGLAEYDPKKVQGRILTQEVLDHLHGKFCGSAPSISRPGLDHGRGEIILAGLKIFQSLLTIIRKDHFTVSDSGLLEGILLNVNNSNDE